MLLRLDADCSHSKIIKCFTYFASGLSRLPTDKTALYYNCLEQEGAVRVTMANYSHAVIFHRICIIKTCLEAWKFNWFHFLEVKILWVPWVFASVSEIIILGVVTVDIVTGLFAWLAIKAACRWRRLARNCRQLSGGWWGREPSADSCLLASQSIHTGNSIRIVAFIRENSRWCAPGVLQLLSWNCNS